MTEHRLLTVRQPWAKPIVDGVKTVENRSHAFGTSYRGPLWIHAGAAWSDRGLVSHLIRQTYPEVNNFRGHASALSFRDAGFVLGAVLGRVDVVDAHHAEPGCCETPWAELEYADGTRAPVGRRIVTDVVHLVFENPARCRGPVVAGALGIWRADRRPGLPETLDALELELERGASC